MRKSQKVLITMVVLLMTIFSISIINDVEENSRSGFGMLGSQVVTIELNAGNENFDKLEEIIKENNLNVVKTGEKNTYVNVEYVDKSVNTTLNYPSKEDILNKSFTRVVHTGVLPFGKQITFTSLDQIPDEEKQGVYFMQDAHRNEKYVNELKALNIGEVSHTLQLGWSPSSLTILLLILAFITLVFAIADYIFYIISESKTIAVYKLFSPKDKQIQDYYAKYFLLLISGMIASSLLILLIASVNYTQMVVRYIYVPIVVICVVYYLIYNIFSRVCIIEAIKGRSKKKVILNIYRVIIFLGVMLLTVNLLISVVGLLAVKQKTETLEKANFRDDYGLLNLNSTYAQGNINGIPEKDRSKVTNMISKIEGGVYLNNRKISQKIQYDLQQKRGFCINFCYDNVDFPYIQANKSYIQDFVFIKNTELNPVTLENFQSDITIVAPKSQENSAKEVMLEEEENAQSRYDIEVTTAIKYVESTYNAIIFDEVQPLVENPIIVIYSDEYLSKQDMTSVIIDYYVPLNNETPEKAYETYKLKVEDQTTIGQQGMFDKIILPSDKMNDIIISMQIQSVVLGVTSIILLIMLLVIIYQFLNIYIATFKSELMVKKILGYTIIKRYQNLFMYEIIIASIVAIVLYFGIQVDAFGLNSTGVGMNERILLAIAVLLLVLLIFFTSTLQSIYFIEKKKTVQLLKGDD